MVAPAPRTTKRAPEFTHPERVFGLLSIMSSEGSFPALSDMGAARTLEEMTFLRLTERYTVSWDPGVSYFRLTDKGRARLASAMGEARKVAARWV